MEFQNGEEVHGGIDTSMRAEAQREKTHWEFHAVFSPSQNGRL
jgi:hypothetical protein